MDAKNMTCSKMCLKRRNTKLSQGEVGATSYTYNANSNIMASDSQTITRDVENRPVSVTEGETTSTFIYDGDGNRVKKTEGIETILYYQQIL